MLNLPIRCVVSSRALAQQLKKLKDERVLKAHIIKDILYIKTLTSSEVLKVGVSITQAADFQSSFDQENRRWDFIKQLVSSISDQPITLFICEEKVQVIFEY